MGIVLTVAAILGLVMTSIVTANPTITSGQAPLPVSSASALIPSIAQVPRLPRASEIALPEHELPPQRPSGIARASVTPAATEAPMPEPAPAILLVALAPLTIDVWNAEERYFSVSGSTPDEIVASALANVPADPSGMQRSTMAYVGPITWDHRPSYVQDSSTGSCTMTAIVSTVTYQATLPQWTAPSSVPPELLAWWQVVIEHIGVHESEHVRIFEGYVSALPGRIVGQPCSAWDVIIGQWSAEVVAAQAAFDAAESHWGLPRTPARSTDSAAAPPEAAWVF